MDANWKEWKYVLITGLVIRLWISYKLCYILFKFINILIHRLLMDLQSQTLLQIWRWWWTWVLWFYTIHTGGFCSSHSCTSTWLRRARLLRLWAPSPAIETASLPSALLSGYTQSAPCTTVSEPAASYGSAQEGWLQSLNPLINTQERGGSKHKHIFNINTVREKKRSKHTREQHNWESQKLFCHWKPFVQYGGVF